MNQFHQLSDYNASTCFSFEIKVQIFKRFLITLYSLLYITIQPKNKKRFLKKVHPPTICAIAADRVTDNLEVISCCIHVSESIKNWKILVLLSLVPVYVYTPQKPIKSMFLECLHVASNHNDSIVNK